MSNALATNLYSHFSSVGFGGFFSRSWCRFWPREPAVAFCRKILPKARVDVERVLGVFLGRFGSDGRIAGRRLLGADVTQPIRLSAEATASLVDLLCLRDPNTPIARLGPTSAWVSALPNYGTGCDFAGGEINRL